MRERLPDLGGPAVVEDPRQARFRLFDSITTFLRKTAVSQPLERGSSGDRERAVALQDEALDIARKLGMRLLTERILAQKRTPNT